MAGRDTKYDEPRAKKILRDLGSGNTRKCAAERAGIGERTFLRWLARGRAGEAPFAAFLAAVKKAERSAEAWHVANIKKSAPKNWTASAWMLERKWPEDWSVNRGEIKALREEMTAVLAELRAAREAIKTDESRPGSPSGDQSGEAPAGGDG